ncbi:MAG: T9SS type A sorting domain-containing protein [Bacteroidales bacterium]
MKKIITSFFLFFMCLSYTWASTGSDLKFIYPVNWEYASVNEMYSYSIVNDGAAFDGRVILFACDANGAVYQLFEDQVSVSSGSEVQMDYVFSDEIQLPVGDYRFFFKYETESGEMLKANGTGTGRVCVPSSVTRVPITTGTIPGGRMSLSTNQVRDEIEVSVNSNVALNRVELVNVVGQTVRAKSVNNEKFTTLEVDGLSAGTYIVVGKADEGVVTVKMLKVKK